jgi:hypothetical protein
MALMKAHSGLRKKLLAVIYCQSIENYLKTRAKPFYHFFPQPSVATRLAKRNRWVQAKRQCPKQNYFEITETFVQIIGPLLIRHSLY